MFDDIEFIETNKDSIMGTMRSAVVCLHVLLKMKHNADLTKVFEEELFKHANFDTENTSESTVLTRDIEISKNHFIVDNLHNILFDDHFYSFREKFIEILHANNLSEYAICFAERLEIAHSLPTETKHNVKSVISSLKKGTGKFFDWFYSSFMQNEHATTQSALLELMFHYFPSMHNIFPSNSSATTDATNYYATQNLDDRQYSYLWGDIPKGKETAEQLELISQRIQCIQEFKAGVVDLRQQDHVWKFKETETPYSSLEEINTLLRFSSDFPVKDFSERLSLTIDKYTHPVLDRFKQKLHKTKLKLKSC